MNARAAKKPEVQSRSTYVSRLIGDVGCGVKLPRAARGWNVLNAMPMNGRAISRKMNRTR